MANKQGGDRFAKYLPTPEQIAAECEAIRAEWSEWETERRRVQKPVPFESQAHHLELPREYRTN